ncbi:ABC transporter permease [Phyllobacterium endophyticum]|uniref:Peptide ABC transporter permease n=1 Tax=Phyllobacterium endophyticum TaxID=1149773 RepID=A0A2P7AKD2_9HYPH|nr:ABC transporter permease [Phyllobacterium endophyticum]MBB3237119.1 peptide/nickel transport system permease protein [Phyllobacterium endophyticum]PSH54652.1 peptide ABC transporter permease [Phyllobacterium endophyticum]TYR40580.1 ABC transporter permease [Phyllobacterium endophyticum]
MTIVSNTSAAPAGKDKRNKPKGPWRTALSRLLRDKLAVASFLFLASIILSTASATYYADHISQTDPFQSNLDGHIEISGEPAEIMAADSEGLGLGVTPIGPTWTGQYLLGADAQGRDVAARLLYGGQNSLIVAFSSTALCLLLAGVVGTVSGFLGGIVDTILSRLLDIIWAFPIYLLAISLSIVLISKGLQIGPFHIPSNSLLLPITIIGVVYVPYVARPIRGQVLTLAKSDFVLASVCLGMPTARILVRDILPNVVTTLIVFAPIMMSLSILTESSLSFLSIGVQPPAASWGTIIQDGQGLLYTRPLVAIAPGLAIIITVLCLNFLGDGVKEAFDPKAKLRVGKD